MARISHNLDFQRSSQLHVDQKPARIDEDDFGVLDDSILDPNSPDMSPSLRHRRESFADSSTAFSPSEPSWPAYQFSTEHAAFHPSNAATHSFVPSQGDVFPSSGPSQSTHYSSHQNAWPLIESSGSCTPTAVPDTLGPEYENRRPAAYNQNMTRAPHQAAFEALQLQTSNQFLSTVPFSASPQSGKDWPSASTADGIDFRSISAQPRPHSPSFLGSTSLLRRDGIRKKNARFEIPAERNLRTIDQLINQTNDEQEIKELKQQKRLLRNRQAALDSRQRKKQHTERLEDEKKHYTAVISDLEEALGEMKVQEAEWTREKESWAAAHLQYQQYIENLAAEKEELVRRHTIETGELRKKNALLIDQLQRMDSTAMSTAPSSTGFSADFSDFDHLTMNSSPWDDFSLANDFSIETEPIPDVPVAPLLKHEKSSVKEGDKAAASSFLLMLLLCGAWVASRSSSNSTNLLPTMPEDMRTASATVLRHIYQDAGVQLQDSTSTNSRFENVHGTPTSAQDRHKTTLSAFEIASISASPLDALHHQLTMPSQDQLREQVFSLTPSQYNELSSDGIFDRGKQFESNRRRNLGETLAAVRGASEGPAADVYVRSLMWDKVPQQVLKDFARMVADSNVGQPQWKVEPMS